ncbi:hypothetical protein C2S51_036762 [Perilla frutescens var. frutescens]|nr:hypothetical protein C2S51_036762 [Perilla frutescens var. frutescens]
MEKSRYKSNEEFQEEEIWGFLNQTKDSDSWRGCSSCNSSFKVVDTITKPLPTANTMILESDKNLRESRTNMSATVNIPADWSKISSKKPRSWLEEEEEEEEKDNTTTTNNNNVMIPPQELIAKNHTSSFSVFEGVGRTLKGRDLSRVRYAVLTKTGFLESKSHHYPL